MIYLPVEAGDFKLLSRSAVDYLVQLKGNHLFVRGLVCWIGFKQGYVQCHRQPRCAGKSKFHVLSPKVINNFFGSALISFSSAPLKIASCFGLLAIFVDFIIDGAANDFAACLLVTTPVLFHLSLFAAPKRANGGDKSDIMGVVVAMQNMGRTSRC